jgi:alkylation response protein AidB-like acyl-CoA dehydrogenase
MTTTDTGNRWSALADRWRSERAERQTRRHLDQIDFDALREAGFLKLIVPEEYGGQWRDRASSARSVCEALRTLGAGDPAVALVAAMHPSVVSFWLLNPDPSQPDWEQQRRAVFASAVAGEQWGTITSEPGSGGDISRTRATADPADSDPFLLGRVYAVSGDKHFGSGSGIAHRMVTTAVPTGEDGPAMFVLDTTDRTWNGQSGMTLTHEWDGVGMAATQSHAMRLDRAPAVRLGFDGPLTTITGGAGALVATTFTAVILGVLDEAVATARRQVSGKADQLRPYEQVEWTRAVHEHWLAVQAYEGSLRAMEHDDPRALYAALSAKEAVAELAESALSRLARVVGGGAYSRRSPFAHWYEDVRALGFLRPPWGLAYDTLFTLSLD